MNPPPRKKKKLHNYNTVTSLSWSRNFLWIGEGPERGGGFGSLRPPLDSRMTSNTFIYLVGFLFYFYWNLRKYILEYNSCFCLFIFFYFLATLDRYIISSFPGRACTSWLSESSMHVYTSYIVERIFLHCPYVLICFLFDLPIFYVYYDFRM